jgi:hypothetical protein
MPGSIRRPRESMVGDPFLGAILPALGFLAKKAGGAIVGAIKKKGASEAIAQLRAQGGVPPTSAMLQQSSFPGAGWAVQGASPVKTIVIPSAPASGPAAPAGSMVTATSRLVRPRYTGYGRRYRRMNVLNLRALKRAIRRTHGFEKIARGLLRAPVHHRFKARRRKR